MLTIKQGRSKSSPYFTLFKPNGLDIKIGDPILSLNPKTNEQTIGTVIDFWKFTWDQPLTGVILLEYGVEPKTIREALVANEPAFNEPGVCLLILRETI